jgi:hypothetical protein
MSSTLLTILITTTATIYALYAMARFHVRALRHSRHVAARNLMAARILAKEIDTALFARDYYRAALDEIINTTPDHDPANQIARRFTNSST